MEEFCQNFCFWNKNVTVYTLRFHIIMHVINLKVGHLRDILAKQMQCELTRVLFGV